MGKCECKCKYSTSILKKAEIVEKYCLFMVVWLALLVT